MIRSKEELQEYVNRGDKVKYVFFWGHQQEGSRVTKSCFSQWYESPFTVDGNNYPTAEHYMMYQKAKLFNDSGAAEKVLNAGNPGEAKAVGRAVQGFNEKVWLENRFKIVVNGNISKFSHNPIVKEFLLNTGNRVLVEASPVDKV